MHFHDFNRMTPIGLLGVFKSRDGKAYRRVFDFANRTTKFAKINPGVALTQVIRQAERAVAPLY
jgi:hypothetical protein